MQLFQILQACYSQCWECSETLQLKHCAQLEDFSVIQLDFANQSRSLNHHFKPNLERTLI